MAKLNANYEVIFILKADLGEEGTEALVTRFKTLIETNGTLTEVDTWGKRHLAYPINDMTEGYYVRMTFTAEPTLPKEMDRIARIADGVMRSMIICLDR